MLAMSDTVRNPYLFVRHPDWQPIFDMDGPLAVKARRQMLDRAAADRMLVEAYHFPFPACGHIVKSGSRLRTGAGDVGAAVARLHLRTICGRAGNRPVQFVHAHPAIDAEPGPHRSHTGLS